MRGGGGAVCCDSWGLCGASGPSGHAFTSVSVPCHRVSAVTEYGRRTSATAEPRAVQQVRPLRTVDPRTRVSCKLEIVVRGLATSLFSTDKWIRMTDRRDLLSVHSKILIRNKRPPAGCATRGLQLAGASSGALHIESKIDSWQWYSLTENENPHGTEQLRYPHGAGQMHPLPRMRLCTLTATSILLFQEGHS